MARFFFFFAALFFGISFTGFGLTVQAVTLENIRSGIVESPTGTPLPAQSIDSTALKPVFLPKFDPTYGEASYKATQSVIYKAINILLFLAGTMAVIVIIIGGFMYVINAGVEDLQNKAKSTILYAVIGLFVIFLSYALVDNVVKYLYDRAEKQPYQQVPTLDQKGVIEMPTATTPSPTTSSQP